jgi:hypothetical protein
MSTNLTAVIAVINKHGKQQVVNYPTRGLSQNGGYPNALSLKGGQKNLMFIYIYIILYSILYYIILYYGMFLGSNPWEFLASKKMRQPDTTPKMLQAITVVIAPCLQSHHTGRGGLEVPPLKIHPLKSLGRRDITWIQGTKNLGSLKLQ